MTKLFIHVLFLGILCMGECFSQAKVPVQTYFRLMERANVLYKQGKLNRAIILYKKAESRGAPTDITAFNIGNALFRLNRLPEAAAAFRKAERSSNLQNDQALLNLAAVLFRLQSFGECISAYRRALKTSPDNVSAWLYLSEAYQRTGDKIGAQSALEKANRLNPDDVTILYQLAENHVSLKEYEAAVSLIRRAYQVKPDEVDFLFYIGDIYRTQGDNAAAANVYREGLTFKPEDVNVLYKLADVLARDEKPYLAMEFLQQALSYKKDFTDAAVFLGNIAFDFKWWERAANAYLQALTYGSNEGMQGLRNLAFEYYGKGQTEDAVFILSEALKLAPSNSELRQELDQFKSLLN